MSAREAIFGAFGDVDANIPTLKDKNNNTRNNSGGESSSKPVSRKGTPTKRSESAAGKSTVGGMKFSFSNKPGPAPPQQQQNSSSSAAFQSALNGSAVVSLDGSSNTFGGASSDAVVAGCRCENPVADSLRVMKCHECGNKFHGCMFNLTAEEANEFRPMQQSLAQSGGGKQKITAVSYKEKLQCISCRRAQLEARRSNTVQSLPTNTRWGCCKATLDTGVGTCWPCRGCGIWFHSYCIGIDDKKIEAVLRRRDTNWFCPDCSLKKLKKARSLNGNDTATRRAKRGRE